MKVEVRVRVVENEACGICFLFFFTRKIIFPLFKEFVFLEKISLKK